nr:transposase [Saccharopolyspora soli]
MRILCCAIPDAERDRPKWVMAVEMLNELGEWRLAPPVVVADAGYGDNAPFRAALEDRDQRGVQCSTGAVRQVRRPSERWANRSRYASVEHPPCDAD